MKRIRTFVAGAAAGAALAYFFDPDRGREAS
jgi:gas vesicle protein